MKAGLWLSMMALTATTVAYAGAVEDGTAGLAALNRGSYDEAIRLFTRALKSGELSPEDREFAYLNRGNAYLAKNDFKDAVADLRKAVELKPDDSDAQASLQAALSERHGTAAGGETRSAQSSPTGGWGFLPAMVGKYYWYQVSGENPQQMFVHVEWATPQQILRSTVHTKDRTIVVAETVLDNTTGKLLDISLTANSVEYGTSEASMDHDVEYYYLPSKPSKQIETLLSDGSIKIIAQTYNGNSWQEAQTVTLVEVSQDTLQAQGFLKHKD
ncbi:MAG: tetratricopeptide repeat protein [Rhizomicrobium sp.]|jgi:tetratricopeptide (TPR) repeat protein